MFEIVIYSNYISLFDIRPVFQGLSEPLFQQGHLRQKIGDSVPQRLLWCVITGCLDSENKLVLEWMWALVASEDHLWVFEKLSADHVADCVVLFVYGEKDRVRNFEVLLDNDPFFVESLIQIFSAVKI